MRIIKVFIGEIIELTKIDEYEFWKTYLTLDGKFKKERIINIQNNRLSNKMIYFSRVSALFKHLIDCEGYEELIDEFIQYDYIGGEIDMNLRDKIEKNQIVYHNIRGQFGICVYNNPSDETMSVEFPNEGILDVSRNHIIVVD